MHNPVVSGSGAALRALPIKDGQRARARRMEQLALVPHHLPDTFLLTTSMVNAGRVWPTSSAAPCFSNTIASRHRTRSMLYVIVRECNTINGDGAMSDKEHSRLFTIMNHELGVWD